MGYMLVVTNTMIKNKDQLILYLFFRKNKEIVSVEKTATHDNWNVNKTLHNVQGMYISSNQDWNRKETRAQITIKKD